MYALQIFSIGPFYSVKATSGNSVKVYTWHPGLTYAMFYLFGPESLGGKGNIRIKAEEIARQTGKPFEQVAREVSNTSETYGSDDFTSCSSWLLSRKKERLFVSRGWHQCILTSILLRT